MARVSRSALKRLTLSRSLYLCPSIMHTMSDAAEVWKEVESKGLRWLVSSAGAVRTPGHTSTYSRTRNGRQQTFATSFPERPLTPCAGRHGYLEVAAMKGGKRVKHLLHRLVAIAFVPGFREDPFGQSRRRRQAEQPAR